MKKPPPHPKLPKSIIPEKTARKPQAPRKKAEPKPPVAHLQPYLSLALENPTWSGTKRPVYSLSKNTIQPNKKIKKGAQTARYGSVTGLPGPKADFDAPIVRSSPRGVYDLRQLLVNTANNEVPDEWGVTNKNRMPMQTINPTSGGKYSGRTGPIR